MLRIARRGVALALCGPLSARADVFGPISLVSAGTRRGQARPAGRTTRTTPPSRATGATSPSTARSDGVDGVWRRDLAQRRDRTGRGRRRRAALDQRKRPVRQLHHQRRHEPSPTITNGRRRGRAPTCSEAVNVYVRDMSDEPRRKPAPSSSPRRRAAPTEPLTYQAPKHDAGLGRRRALRDQRRRQRGRVRDHRRLRPHRPGDTARTEHAGVAGRGALPRERRNEARQRRIAKRGGPVSATRRRHETYGAVFPRQRSGLPGAPRLRGMGRTAPPGASISADGSTVAWMGEDIGEQARDARRRNPRPRSTPSRCGGGSRPGSESPTERVTGARTRRTRPARPAARARSGDQPLAVRPLPGPVRRSTSQGMRSDRDLADRGGTRRLGDFVPRLSADGYTSRSSPAPLPAAAGENFNAARRQGEQADLYVADMHPGLTRDQALTPLTELASGTKTRRDHRTDLRLRHLARRRPGRVHHAAHPVPARRRRRYVSAPAAEPGMSELFDADLRDATLTRVTQGYEGGPSEQPHPPKRPEEEDLYGNRQATARTRRPSPPTATLLAFSSTASNLVFGDGNTPVDPGTGPLDGSDAFVVARQRARAAAHLAVHLAGARNDTGARLAAGRDRAVALATAACCSTSRCPAAGTLRAAAQGSVLVRRRRIAPRARTAVAHGAAPRAAARRQSRADGRSPHGRAAGKAFRRARRSW